MIEYWDFWDGYDYGSVIGQGQTSTLPVENSRDLVAELHEAVEEVTRKPIDKPASVPMGFY